MALIKCSECGNKINDNETICSNCGCPIDIIDNKSVSNDFHNSKQKNTDDVIFKYLLYIIIGGIVGYIFYSFFL